MSTIETRASPPRADARMAALSYSLGLVTGVLCLWLCADRPFVRFHAWQSTLLWVAAALTIVGLDQVPIVGRGLAAVVLVAAAFLTLILIWRSWRGRWTALPLVGDVALEQALERT